MTFFSFQLTGFGSPIDPGVSNAIRTLSNLEFMVPTSAETVKALKLLEDKLKTTDHNSAAGRHLIDALGKHLCPKKDGKPSESDVYSALLGLEAKAKELTVNVSYSNTNFMQGLIGDMVKKTSDGAQRAVKISKL